MKVKIKKGALVGQDLSYYKWPHHESYDVNQLFEVSELDGEASKNRMWLIAEEIADNQSVDFPILDIIDDHLRNGASIEMRDDRVCLIRADGEVVAKGENLKAMLINAVLILC